MCPRPVDLTALKGQPGRNAVPARPPGTGSERRASRDNRPGGTSDRRNTPSGSRRTSAGRPDARTGDRLDRTSDRRNTPSGPRRTSAGRPDARTGDRVDRTPDRVDRTSDRRNTPSGSRRTSAGRPDARTGDRLDRTSDRRNTPSGSRRTSAGRPDARTGQRRTSSPGAGTYSDYRRTPEDRRGGTGETADAPLFARSRRRATGTGHRRAATWWERI